MNVLKKLNQVIEYIEDHLTDDLQLKKISEYVQVSDYHFRTVFFHLAGMTLSEYIKNRRLAEANRDLLRGEKVTDVAYKYRYQSLDGFTRAFTKWSGILPSEVAKKQASKSFPKLTFLITVQGGKSMRYKVVEMPTFYLAGVSKRVPMQFVGVNNEIVELAKSITEEQRKEMHALQNIEPYQVVNASYNADSEFEKEEGELTHMIGVLTTNGDSNNLLEKVKVEAATWAVFPNEGSFPETMQNTMAQIYAEWLPSADYELICAPNFSFTKMSENKKNYAYCEIWIPVQKKKVIDKSS
ncbi:AraC family transcriptional regulator [Ohessyouella blattaphilus]|uniref:AraC family transcriptional regulator n=2 Tax=Ohessyouella blattaphilus TaxID=2949333 RepID=UPI0023DFF490|nr:AraC family transcriptional regulator [Ohessyouella blattaphilus]